ncbi:putative membrane associated with a signal peptide and a transmembrane domain near the carboxy-terminus [Cryptosporidium sp. chipmunk genotype I]|uniref:putative membrane associated with a signal peptide and a transmembrane domain near the carboxy-terminus n=1 Tax=Cryptosporidium sp. chipmunk genotype I TaxID=1280935 RepID=UPI00351A9386|nr:putative membrane associated with a signal peptide and a transmembrane domain near the carboxy-terminus [Cryptosporidium sp. chipmunk genotype I]
MKFKYKTKLLVFIFTIICKFGTIESAIYRGKERFKLPKFWDVKERFSYIRNDTSAFDSTIENSNVSDGDPKCEKSYIQQELFTKEEKRNYVENKYQSLETIREDLIRNWAFNIKYGSSMVVKETHFRIIMFFVRKTIGSKEIRKEQVIDEIDKKNILNREDPNEDSVFFNLKKREKRDDKFIKELTKPINSIPKCWEIYSRITTSYSYELFDREFDSFIDSENQDSTSVIDLDKENTLENTKILGKRFEYNEETFEKLGIKDAVKLVEPVSKTPKLPEKSKMLSKHQDRNKFLLRLTCEFYMKAIREIHNYLRDEYEQYDFEKIQIESKIYHTWKKLYLRSPSDAMWYLFKQIIPVRGDLTVFGLSNGDLPLLPKKERMSIPDIPPDFFEYTTIPKSCSNNLVALSLNNGYRIQLGITKTPKYIQFGKLYRYFEHSLTTSFTSLNLCMRTIKLQTLFQAYYYQSVNEYRPDPSSFFYWQTPDWDSLSGYISYLQSDRKALFPSRNQFVWCLLWATTEYTRTFSRFRVNPIKISVEDILHIPMKMQKIGNGPNLEACFILVRYFWLARLIRINKRKYRPLKTDSPQDVILDYSSIYYVCIAILKCRATFHRSYLKHFRREDINPAIEKVFDTQDPYGDYNNLNNRFLILSIPKLRSLKKVKAILYGVVSTVLFGALTGITLLNILTSNQIPSGQIMRSGYHNPLQDLNLIHNVKL